MAYKFEPKFVVCVQNKECEDLILRKVYQVLIDESAAKEGYLRVIDESGEDYLYPANYFVVIDFPEAAEHILLDTFSVTG